MNDLIVQQPALNGTPAEHLFLLFHGVGGSAEDLHALGTALAIRHPRAWIISVQAPQPADQGLGWQWFSVRGVTDDNRADRVAHAMPSFLQAVTRWQQHSGVPASHTTLLGFSQGAIMALATTQQALPAASRVAALAGRFAVAPTQVPPGTRIHLLHGQADSVVPTQASVDAYTQLQALRATVTLDVFPHLGHGIDARVAARLWERLADGAG
jgi:phospholipase/carboxylesterase